MLSNVWEWTDSFWNNDGQQRFIRGGSYEDRPHALRCPARSFAAIKDEYFDDILYDDIGFRLLLTLPNGKRHFL